MTSLLAAVRLAHADGLPALRARVDVLSEFYAPIGEVRRSARWLPVPGVMLIAMRFGGGAPPDPKRPLSWGLEVRALLDVPEDELRRLGGPLLAVEGTERRVRVVTSAEGPVSAYTARQEGLAEAWASHAVAAAWLAGVIPEIDPEGVAEQVAFGFAGSSGRTLVSGARPVPPATVVDIDAEGVWTRSFWPETERWAPMAPEEARARAAEAFPAALETRLARATRPVVALTRGLDSRCAAVALRRRGVSSVCVALPEDVEAVGARRAAAALGLPHRDLVPRAEDPERLERFARWSDGLPPGMPEPGAWPAGTTHLVLGLGGRTGRAHEYRWLSPSDRRREPRPRVLRDALLLPARERLEGGPVDALDVSEWLEDAALAGHDARWSALDVVHAQRRLFRGGRALLPVAGPPVVCALAAPSVQRALASLPLEDKRTDGFQRRFLLRHAQALSPVLVPPRPRPIPSPLVRARAAQRLRARGRHLPSGAAEGPAWLVELVATSDAVRGALGDAWLSRQGERGARGAASAWSALRAAAAAAALEAAIARTW